MIKYKPVKIQCYNPKHNNKLIKVVCMIENCDQFSRMGCIDCFKFTHIEHLTDLIDYDDVNII